MFKTLLTIYIAKTMFETIKSSYSKPSSWVIECNQWCLQYPSCCSFSAKLCQTKGAENETFVAHKASIYIGVTASTRQCALVTKLTLLCSCYEQNKAPIVQRATLATKTHLLHRKNVILGFVRRLNEAHSATQKLQLGIMLTTQDGVVQTHDNCTLKLDPSPGSEQALCWVLYWVTP